MNIMEKYADEIHGIFSDWIQVIDNRNGLTVEDFPYETGVIAGVVIPHCVKCTSANRCWFKNEEDKKPEKFDYDKYPMIEKEERGLYHPKCHCKEYAIKSPKEDDIELIIPDGKIAWLNRDKSRWVRAFGYEKIEDFVDVIAQATKKAFVKGEYTKVSHSNFGFKINLFVSVPGQNEKSGRIYDVKTSFMIFPDGKLKNNTLLGGWK